MPSTLDELQDYRVYNKQIYLPVNDDNRKQESAMFLLTPNLTSSLNFVHSIYITGRTSNVFTGNNNWESYYMEKDVSYYINNENHTMSRINDQVIEEDGEIKIQKKEKGKLSEFKRIDINEDTLEEQIMKSDKVSSVIEYFPWTGYFYLTEDDKLVAGVNVNVDERFIQSLFVTEDKYSYLYRELIEEARKLKANSVILDSNDHSISALTEFGFSKIEDYGNRIKLQFKVPIEEKANLFGAQHDLWKYCKSTYKFSSKYDDDCTEGTLEIIDYYAQKMRLNRNVTFLMGWCHLIENAPQKIYADLQLRKWMNEQEIMISIQAIQDLYNPNPDIIYSRILHDASMMCHYTNKSVLIQDTVDWYFDEYEIPPRDWLYMEEVDIIEERIRQTHGKSTPNDWMLKLSYTYYRDKGGKITGFIKKGLRAKIIEMYHVRINESTQNDIAANLINESHMTFGFKDEHFDLDYPGYKGKNTDKSFIIQEAPKYNRGIILRDGSNIQGVVRVNNENMITEMMCNNISPEWLSMIANRKFLANKACIPNSCTMIRECFDRSNEWNYVYTKDGYRYYDLDPNAEYMAYPDIGIDEETRDMYNRLDDEAKQNLGNQYLNEICVTNTIYRKVYKEIGLVDLYINPTFPKIAWFDIAVLEDKRGKGKATDMVRETMDYVKKNFPKLDSLGWICKESNKASYQTALKVGFVPQTTKNGYASLFWHIHTPDAQLFANESYDYNEENMEWSSRDINLNCINEDGVYMLTDNDIEVLLNESTNGNKFKQILWNDRIKSNKEVLTIYKQVKDETNGRIKNTFLNLDLYKKKNLFVDLSFYMNSFFNNFKRSKSDKKDNEFFFTFIKKLIKDPRINKDYHKLSVYIPMDDWKSDLSPMSSLLYMANYRPELLSETFRGIDFIFTSEIGFFFKCDFGNYNKNRDLGRLKTACSDLLRKVNVDKDEKYTKKALMHTVLDRLEMNPGKSSIKVNSINAKAETDPKKKELVKRLDKATDRSNNIEDAGDELDTADREDFQDDYTIDLVKSIADREKGNVNISAARSKRLDGLTQNFLNSKVTDTRIRYNGTMRDYMRLNEYNQELPETELPIESINDDWKHMKFTNFEKVYNLHSDIYNIIYFLDSRSDRLSVRGQIKIEDTSTSEDWKETWTVPFENEDGKRFSFKFDLPLLKDNRNMVLGGNDKTINGQLVLLPISKTDEDTVQIVSNYNKIFIRRYSTGECRSTRQADVLSKALDIAAKEMKGFIKILYGNSTMNNAKYNLPHDYVDLSSKYYTIQLYDNKKLIGEVYFNQDNAKKELGLKEEDERMPIGWTMNKKGIHFFQDKVADNVCSTQIMALIISADKSGKFNEIVSNTKPSVRHTYSKASILATEVPVIILMAYSEGLQTALKKGHIKYILSEKRMDKVKATHDVIKFKDCFLYYEDDYNSSMLMNGLKEVNTQDYSIRDTDDKLMWTEFLDYFGGRIKADGLDNFYDLMMDPITVQVCMDYNLPTDYCELLAYANLLLADNEYIKHTDLSSNRFRTNELIAARAFKCIATAYANYKLQRKKSRTDAIMTMKQSAILDALLEESTMSDLSILNPLLEAEAKNSVSFKGFVGMNSDRSYSLDKRTYDPSMINKVAMSTGFAGNVGVNRQTTINMNIKGTRGYIKNSDIDDASIANTLSMTEALTPFGTTRDDPFRTAMTNIQTSKHNMRINKAMPLLVTNGADQALPYLTGDTFAFKAKESGKVVKMTKDYMVVEYDKNPYTSLVYVDPKSKKEVKEKYTEIIDLRENIKKNSDGGFYITVKLDTDLKKGSRFKKNDILAYDHQVYNNEVGDGKNIAYGIGALANIAYINTDEGIEDSAIISNRLSECLSSEVVVQISKNLPANTNIFKIVNKGDPVQEGDTLLLYQSPFDEEDANAIMKQLAMDKKEVSEMGRIPVRSKVTGVVQDIKIYRTVEYSEMSSSMKSLVKKYEGQLQDIAKEEAKAKNKIDIDPTYKLPATSKMKNCEGKVKIEFYLKYNDKMGIGDKLVFMSAIKGETKNIFPIGEEPYTDSRPDEIVDSLCPLPSILHRMVASVKILTGLYKGVIELTREMKEAVGLKYEPYNPRIKK